MKIKKFLKCPACGTESEHEIKGHIFQGSTQGVECPIPKCGHYWEIRQKPQDDNAQEIEF